MTGIENAFAALTPETSARLHTRRLRGRQLVGDATIRAHTARLALAAEQLTGTPAETLAAEQAAADHPGDAAVAAAVLRWIGVYRAELAEGNPT